jgi:phosphatidylglycerophosphate synthase
MPTPVRPGVSQVMASYAPKRRNELRNEWAVALLYRPVSMLLTPLVVAACIPPVAITLAGLAAALALPWLALYGGPHGAAYVGMLAIACCILDCIDGDTARVTGRTSRAGAYLDFAVDTVYRVSVYAALGLLVDAARAGAGPAWLTAMGASGGLVVGLLCALCAIMARQCRLYADAHTKVGEAADKAMDATPSSTGRRIYGFFSGLDHLLPLAIIILGLADRLPLLLAWLAVYSLGDLVLTQKSVLARLE